MTDRIRWTKEDDGGTAGRAGTLDEPLFFIYPPESPGKAHILTAMLPGHITDFYPSGFVSDLKAKAEEWLAEFVSSLGVVFPEGDAIIRWQDVRGGDLVLLDDTLVTAERVTICQKPWGDGITFTAADISHRLDNGVLVTSERHGDRHTAVRRPVAEAAVKAGEKE